MNHDLKYSEMSKSGGEKLIQIFDIVFILLSLWNGFELRHKNFGTNLAPKLP